MNAPAIVMRDDVRRLQPADYDHALELYLEALRRLRGVVAVYQLGNVKFPGISDIDLIVVVNDKIVPGTNFRRLMHSAAGPDGAYIFSHASYVISRECFAQLPMLFYADNLEHRWGEELGFATLAAEQAAFCGYQIAVEAAIGQTFPFLRSLTERTAPNLRSLLCHLNAVRHNFTTISRWIDCGERRHWTDYVARIDRLRGGWFTLAESDRFREVAELLADARQILFEVLSELARIGITRGFASECALQRSLSLLDVNILLRFQPGDIVRTSQLSTPLAGLRQQPVLSGIVTGNRRLREVLSDIAVLDLPATLYPLLGSWTDERGELAEVLRSRQLGAIHNARNELTPAVRGWAAERENLLNKYFAFMRRNRITGALLLTPATWLTPSRSIANRVKTGWNLRWVRRILSAQ